MIPQISHKIAQIEQDKVHGASFISQQALGVMKLAVERSESKNPSEFLAELREVGMALKEIRPNMASIANSVSRFIHEVFHEAGKGIMLADLKSFAYIKGDEIIQASQQASLKAAENGAGILKDKDVVLTSSYSSTVCHALKIASRQGKLVRVLALKSRSIDGKSYGEITAHELEMVGITASAISDASIKHYISVVDKVLVGADSVFADGFLINGTPTYQLALAARKNNVPVYAICEIIKFSAQSYQDKELHLETGFDIIPPNLITGIVTERGEVAPEKVIDQVNLCGELPVDIMST